MAETTKAARNLFWQFFVLAVLLAVLYTAVQTLRFKAGALNFIVECLCYSIPLFAIRPVSRLHQRPRILGFILLTPLLLLSSFLLLGKVVFDGILGGSEHRQLLQTFQQGNCTIQLERYENGGAVGVHGLNLEQRRLLFPGLYLVKSIDFFDSAGEGTLSVEGPYKVRVYAKGNYYNNDYQVEKVYNLKPWVYF
ncbi:MAG: hypothetical protein ABSG00_07605 [Terracidiphilus sp.]|jgi:hypothetical protein